MNISTSKYLAALAFSTLLFGCAEKPIVYQNPAPVYRPQQGPLTQRLPAPTPTPAPKFETYKLPDEPIVSDEISATDSGMAPSAAVPETGGSMEAGSAAAAAAMDENYSAPSVPVSGSPAVLALMQDVERNSSSGDLETAAVTVERALRIDSRNASLYYKLAQIRLQQNQPRLAEDLGKKSALLADDNYELKKNSWLLIAKARHAQGNRQGAEDARAKANGM